MLSSLLVSKPLKIQTKQQRHWSSNSRNNKVVSGHFPKQKELHIFSILDDSEGPEFTKLTYTATYTIHKDDADEITIDDAPIQIQNVDDPSKLTLTIGRPRVYN
jgi:hypothetical protein